MINFFDKYKSSKVAEGYKKKYRIDYSETFSLIVKPQTMRIVLILAISYDWDLKYLDINNDFLNGDLVEEVYMYQF